MTMTLGSLFAGVGGFDLGFERAGFRTVWQCEVDEQAQGVLRRWFPHASLHGDVCAVGAHNLTPVDVVTFGSPCQDVSLSGKRAGLAGARSGLFFEAVRIIKELREAYGKPDFAIWENVPGAFTSNGGRDFGAVLQALADIGAMDICWRVLDSQFFGVPQRRRRCFLAADFGGHRAEQILFEPQGSGRHSAKGQKARSRTAASIGSDAAEGGWPVSVVATLDTTFGLKHGLNDQHVTGGCPWFVPVGDAGLRRLMPEEFEALQNFPQGWTAGQSLKYRYKQMGNAVTVNVAEWIGRRVAASLQTSKETANG